MKIKNFLKELVVLTFVVFAFSCSSSDDGNGDNTGNEDNQETSISINASSGTNSSVTNIYVGESVIFSVSNNLGANVMAGSVITVNGDIISGNTYTFDTAGTYVIVVTNGDFTDTITIIVEEIPVPTAITLTANKDSFWYNTSNTTFTVMDDLGNNVTGLSTFTAETGTLSNPATFSSAGTYNVVATFTLPDNTTLTSNSLEIKAVASTHTTKVMIEDYTGTWCGYCPRLATALENAANSNDNIIPVAIHDDNEMEFPYVNQMTSTFGVTGFPTGKINRTINWNESTTQPTNLLDNRQSMGLAINSSISGNTITAEVKVHYDLKADSANRIVVYLLENGLAYNQANYYNTDSSSPWYQAGNPIVGFVHDHVAITTFTDVMGDTIPTTDTNTDSTHTANYTLTVPSSVQNTTNLELVAFVVGPNNKVLNAQKADLGEDKDFD